jgi:2-polyprenyl-3-methyl-5-hydroxy-6-metoxy-1,4-benzoquinol methylase
MMRYTFDLPVDGFQREVIRDVLRRAGAPFELGDAAAFRENVGRVWGLYQAEMARVLPEGRRTTQVAHRLDRLIYERKRQEYIDDPAIPVERREQLSEHLAHLNRVLLSYHWFFKALEAFLADLPPGEVSILDIGSGHGRFPIAMAKKRRIGKQTLRVVGSDIDPAYVEQARAEARRQKVKVEFRQVDALMLDRMEERFDIITSTQTVHHFPPPFVAELIARARANARQGIAFFDARRSALSLAGVMVSTALVSRDPYFMHDGIVSVRRMYSPAEFEMLAACAPGGDSVTARNLAYSFVVVEGKSADGKS